MTYEEKLYNKCADLLRLVEGIQDFYKTSNDDSKRFIETVIGAAIWYLPKNAKLLFTGKISKDAIVKNEKSEDHFFPRKIAAQEILEFEWVNENDPVETLCKFYLQKYGRFNYVSKIENKKLIKFQRSNVFIDSDTAYANAKIELVDFDKNTTG